MSIQIIPKSRQAYGAFNGGEIVENKPIGFPQDQGSTRPYSNLFYWAHAKAVVDSTIGLHPHQGFEICSFILSGEIRHYDTKLREWRQLQGGDVQIIRAGNGISHSEWMGKDAEMFQIWFDPNLSKTLHQPASYNDYMAEVFPETIEAGIRTTTLVGPGSPFTMDTPGIKVQKLALSAGSYLRSIEPGEIWSVYMIRGAAVFNGADAQISDFILAKDESSLQIEVAEQATLFVIQSPLEPGYTTYAKARGI